MCRVVRGTRIIITSKLKKRTFTALKIPMQ